MYNFPQATFDKVLSKEGVESDEEEDAEGEEEEEEEQELGEELEREFVADFAESDEEGDIEVSLANYSSPTGQDGDVDVMECPMFPFGNIENFGSRL